MPVIEMIETICDIVALENNQPIHQQCMLSCRSL